MLRFAFATDRRFTVGRSGACYLITRPKLSDSLGELEKTSYLAAQAQSALLEPPLGSQERFFDMFSLKHLLPIAFMAVAAPAVAQDMQFELINTSGYTLMEFYASPSDVGSWEADILGANVLPSGSSGTVNIADGRAQCTYDIRMVFDDGTDLTDSVNVCDIGSYTIQ